MNNSSPVRIDNEQLAQLHEVKKKTGMTLKFILIAAISEWLDRHAPSVTVTGKTKLNKKEKI